MIDLATKEVGVRGVEPMGRYWINDHYFVVGAIFNVYTYVSCDWVVFYWAYPYVGYACIVSSGISFTMNKTLGDIYSIERTM